ncbi:hypothetical protein B0T11DRAFT_270729 [Plectosphaerella cucumerina]|uniref:Uncharacterized protein n=1 Tax=Plectosphaerella cucumerina TaxID=40658 RepID=A0A8K0X9I7_9PEZI|nr:hypothetical protein B0T11DRAFT_270729 [Plectosphaerella cucumerina]
MFRLEARRPIVRPRPPPFMMGLFGTRSRHRAERSCSFDLKFANREGGGTRPRCAPSVTLFRLIQGPPLSILWCLLVGPRIGFSFARLSPSALRDGTRPTGNRGRGTADPAGSGPGWAAIYRRRGMNGVPWHGASAVSARDDTVQPSTRRLCRDRGGGWPERGQNNGLCSAPQACLVLALGYPPVGVPASGVIGNVRAVSLRGRGRCRGGEVR